MIAHIRPAGDGNSNTDGPIREVTGRGATYELARDAVEIPDGWSLAAWFVPEHLDRGIG